MAHRIDCEQVTGKGPFCTCYGNPRPTEMTSLREIKAKLDSLTTTVTHWAGETKTLAENDGKLLAALNELGRKLENIDTVQDAIRFEATRDRGQVATQQQVMDLGRQVEELRDRITECNARNTQELERRLNGKLGGIADGIALLRSARPRQVKKVRK